MQLKKYQAKVVALSTLFEYLCETSALDSNPVKGAKRPKVDSGTYSRSKVGWRHSDIH
ncbi:MAG: hypothetical protein ACI802_002300 [Candidatus Paceibacteria bacterium]|jgi:hypothetical protein